MSKNEYKYKNPLVLSSIPDSKLNIIMSLAEDDFGLYIENLIEKYYPGYSRIGKENQDYVALKTAYKASFLFEVAFRNTKFLQEYFTPIYTKTGLVRELVNDLFFTEESLITH